MPARELVYQRSDATWLPQVLLPDPPTAPMGFRPWVGSGMSTLRPSEATHPEAGVENRQRDCREGTAETRGSAGSRSWGKPGSQGSPIGSTARWKEPSHHSHQPQTWATNSRSTERLSGQRILHSFQVQNQKLNKTARTLPYPNKLHKVTEEQLSPHHPDPP